MAMDRKERERELVSKLLSASSPELLTTDQLGKVSSALQLSPPALPATPPAAHLLPFCLARSSVLLLSRLLTHQPIRASSAFSNSSTTSSSTRPVRPRSPLPS